MEGGENTGTEVKRYGNGTNKNKTNDETGKRRKKEMKGDLKNRVWKQSKQWETRRMEGGENTGTEAQRKERNK